MNCNQQLIGGVQGDDVSLGSVELVQGGSVPLVQGVVLPSE